MASSTFPTGSDRGAHAPSSSAQPPLVDRMAETAHHVVDDLASKAGPAAERVRSSVSNTMESVHRGMDGLSNVPSEWAESCRQSVREHPLAM
ncbi:MAG: hypothetical protein KJ011_07350, partial [Burkholderiaceae bacterium]|nr:hypothetical protein [Burkholderiaceae bacterium]